MNIPNVGWRARIVCVSKAVLLCASMLLMVTAWSADGARSGPVPTSATTPATSMAMASNAVTPSIDQSNTALDADTDADTDTSALARKKLGEEIRQLQLANNQADSSLAGFLPFAPFLTVLVAVGTLAATLWKQSSDAAAARSAAAADASRWRADFALQQQAEAAKNEQWRQEFLRQKETDRIAAEQKELGRFDDTLSRISAQISSDNPGLSLNGAAALGLFVKPRYQDLHSDLLRMIIANLKAAPKTEVGDLLRDDLAKVLNMLFAEGLPNPDVPGTVDLTHLNLYRLDLQGLKLPASTVLDFAFATLDDANLSEMHMARARGFRTKLDAARFSRTVMTEARFNEAHATEKPVHFHETRLVSATFDDAKLPGAQFQRAKLQGAKFRRCDLREARFEDADMNDAYFQGAILDEAALRSIALGAHNWSSAKFDPVHDKRIKEIASS